MYQTIEAITMNLICAARVGSFSWKGERRVCRKAIANAIGA
jgi:hypothetical protein